MSAQEKLDQMLVEELLDHNQRREERAPAERQKLGTFTVACLILNRTIGSGIFVTPRVVLLGTRSVGASIFLWAIGGIVSTSGLLVWLQLGLSVPKRTIPGGSQKSVPRSGGEKNYLEYVLKSPKFLATCMYGIPFLVLGNLAGNAIAFGTYVLQAAGYANPNRGAVIGLSIGSLTVACLIHVFSRRGGILLSNGFAVFKVAVLLAIAIIGFAVGAGAHFGPGVSYTSNLSVHNSFANAGTDVSSYTFSLLNVLYSFSGFEQPFYVLSEVRQPRRIFPRATISAMAIATFLFVIVNIAYVCAIPVTPEFLNSGQDIVTLFFSEIFGPRIAPRVMAGVVALCIFGNIIVMTFTASRVKQEIAKEGILPFSLVIASGHTTPDAWIRGWLQERKLRNQRRWSNNPQLQQSTTDLPEQTPMVALLLHWFMSVLLIAVTSMLSAATAYFALVFLYSYVLVVLVGFCVSTSLLYLWFNPHRRWADVENFRPWGGPTAAFIYSIVSLFVLITAFLSPANDSPFAYNATHIQWYILPSIGLSSVLWGVIWWLGLHSVMASRGLELVVTRLPHIEQDEEDGEWVQRAEVIDHVWQSKAYTRKRTTSEEEGSIELRRP